MKREVSHDKTVLWTGSFWEQAQAVIHFIRELLSNQKGSVLVILPEMSHPFHDVFWESIEEQNGKSQLISKDKYESNGDGVVSQVLQGTLEKITISDLVEDKGNWKAQVKICGTTKGQNFLYKDATWIKGIIIIGVGEMLSTWWKFSVLHSVLARLSFLNNPPKALFTVSTFDGDTILGWLKSEFGFSSIDRFGKHVQIKGFIKGLKYWVRTARVKTGELFHKKDSEDEIARIHGRIANKILFKYKDTTRLVARKALRKVVLQKVLDIEREHDSGIEKCEEEYEEKSKEMLKSSNGYGNGNGKILSLKLDRLKAELKENNLKVISRYREERENFVDFLVKLGVKVKEDDPLLLKELAPEQEWEGEVVEEEEGPYQVLDSLFSEEEIAEARRILELSDNIQDYWDLRKKTEDRGETRHISESKEREVIQWVDILKDLMIRDILRNWGQGNGVEDNFRLCLVTEEERVDIFREMTEQDFGLENMVVLSDKHPLRDYDNFFDMFDRVVIDFRDRETSSSSGVRLLRFLSLVKETGRFFCLASFKWWESRITGIKDIIGPYWEPEEWSGVDWEEMSDIVLGICRVTRTKRSVLEYSSKIYPIVAVGTIKETNAEQAFLSSIKILRELQFLDNNRMRDTERGRYFSKLGVKFQDCKKLVDRLREKLDEPETEFSDVWKMFWKGIAEISQSSTDFSRVDVLNDMLEAIMDGRKPNKRDLTEATLNLQELGSGYSVQVAVILTDLLSGLMRDIPNPWKEEIDLTQKWFHGVSHGLQGKFQGSEKEEEEWITRKRPGRPKGSRKGEVDGLILDGFREWTFRGSEVTPRERFQETFVDYHEVAQKKGVCVKSAFNVIKRIFCKDEEKFENWLAILRPHHQEIAKNLREVGELERVCLEGGRPALIIVLNKKEPSEVTLKLPDYYNTKMKCGDCAYFLKRRRACLLFYRFRTTYPSDIPAGLTKRGVSVSESLMACPWIVPHNKQPIVYIQRVEKEFGGLGGGFYCPRCQKELEELPRPGKSVFCEECGTVTEVIEGKKLKCKYRIRIGLEDSLRRDFKLIGAKDLPKLPRRLRGPVLKGLHKRRVVRLSADERVKITPLENSLKLEIKGWKGERTEIIGEDDVVDVPDNNALVRKLIKLGIRVNHRTVNLLIRNEDYGKFVFDSKGEPVLFLWKQSFRKTDQGQISALLGSLDRKEGVIVDDKMRVLQRFSREEISQVLKKIEGRDHGILIYGKITPSMLCILSQTSIKSVINTKGEEWLKFQYSTNEISYVQLVQKPDLAHQLRGVGVIVGFTSIIGVPRKPSKELKEAIPVKGVRERLIWTHSASLSLSVYFALLSLVKSVKGCISQDEAEKEISRHQWRTSNYLNKGDFSRMRRNSLEGRGFFPFVRAIRQMVFEKIAKDVKWGKKMIDPEIGRARARRVDVVKESSFELAAALTPYDSALNYLNQRLRRKLRRINAKIGYGFDTVPLFSHTSRDRPSIAGHLDLEEVGRIITRLVLLKLVIRKVIRVVHFEERLDRFGLPYFVPNLLGATILSRALDRDVLKRKIRYKGKRMDFIRAHKRHVKELYDYIISAGAIIRAGGENISRKLEELDEGYTPLVFAPSELMERKRDKISSVLRDTEDVWIQGSMVPRSLDKEGEIDEIQPLCQILWNLFEKIEDSIL